MSSPFDNERNKRPWGGYDLSVDENYIIKEMSHGIYLCPSEKLAGMMYTTNLAERRCECPDFMSSNGYKDCKHIFACDFRFGKLVDTEPPPFNEWYANAKSKPGRGNRWWGGESFSQRKNLSLARMDPRTNELIEAVVIAVIPEAPARIAAGQPPIPDRDLAITILSKVANKKSLRSMSSYIDQLFSRRSITRKFHYNKLCAAMSDPRMTLLLHEIFCETTCPFGHISDDAAADSTQIANGSSANSVDKKTGRTRSDRPSITWLKGHFIWSIYYNVVLGYTFTWNVGKGSADEVNYSDAFAMARKNAQIKRIAGDGAYGCDLCLADTINAGVQPYFMLESRWNPLTKKFLSITQAIRYKEFWESDAFKAFYGKRNLAECGNKVLKEITDGFVWTRPAREEQIHLPNVVPGEKAKKSKPGEVTDKITAEELREIRLKAREIGTSSLNECLAKLIIMNLHATVIAEDLHKEKVRYGKNFRFSPLQQDMAS